MSQQTIELQCQSCGMPLTSAEMFGTDSSGNAVQEYCNYCYADGRLTQPDFTVNDMISFCIPFLVEAGMDENAARANLAGSLPSLKRWSAAPSYTLVQLEEFKLAGIATTTTNEQESSDQAKIGALWDKFWTEGVQQSIPHLSQTSGRAVYGCYANYEDGAAGEYQLLIGCKVAEIDALPAGLEGIAVPASRYAVFTTKRGPVMEVVIEAWQEIWKWSATSTLQRTFTGDFEVYDERSADPNNVQVDIYIAVK